MYLIELELKLGSGELVVDNIALHNGAVIGMKRNINRLPVLENGALVSRPSIVIINKIANVGYTIATYTGEILKVSTRSSRAQRGTYNKVD